MKAAREWTAEQKNALEARNTSLVVSAAAGSGKTSVLTERIVGLLSDEKNPVRASRLVVVTFTSNAAREISGRLYDALSDAISHGEGAAHLSSQLLALSRAHISTVHSFCFSLIRDYRKVLGLPEKLRVGEDTETAEMKEEAAAAAVEAFLKGEGGQSPARRETLFRLFGDSKKSTALTETILRAMEQLSSYPSGSEGLAEGVEKLREESLALSKGSYRFGETGLGRVVAEKLEETS